MFRQRESLILTGPSRRELSKAVKEAGHGPMGDPASSLWIIPAVAVIILLLVQVKVFDYSANYGHVTETYNTFLTADCTLQADGGPVGCDHDFGERGIDLANVDALVRTYYDHFFLRQFLDEPKLFDMFSIISIILMAVACVFIFAIRNVKLSFAIIRHILKHAALILFVISLIVLVSGFATLMVFSNVYHVIGFGSKLSVWLSMLWPFIVQLGMSIALFAAAALFAPKETHHAAAQRETAGHGQPEHEQGMKAEEAKEEAKEEVKGKAKEAGTDDEHSV